MPYVMVSKMMHGHRMYANKNIETGKVHGWTTYEKALAQKRLLLGVEHGMVPRTK